MSSSPSSSSPSSSTPSPDSPAHDLAALGWDGTLAEQFTEYESRGLVAARVTRVDRGRCHVLTASGTVRADSTAVTTSDPERTVCTGDWAALELGPQPRIVAVLPRRGVIARASVGRTSHRQVLAANVDTACVVVSLAAPIKPGRIERLLALAWDAGTTPLIVLTKADAAECDPGTAAAEVSALAIGVDVVTVSARTGEGIDELARRLPGTTVLLGPSGAGKSSLTNALLGEDRMDTNEVRATDGKGRHATVHRELFPVPGGGVLIDTPGLRGIGVHDVGDGIEHVFGDIEEMAQGCGFRDCRHRSEPRCAVQDAVTDGRLDLERLDRYRRMLRESEWAASRGDARQAGKRTAADKAITRDIKALYRLRGRRE
ncbi:GTPase RsgA [Prescottella equi]|uniref:ribosome small subunit-dependent GTPase A n=1 Tax=Rhodococcus hoagii TaxID=43767 RepID=UPI0009C0B71D|nr:ribosome small subunit-dependent GTPase A [Prescottella equi]OQQ35280.1 GTPase RsgA [Prescottella equi]